MQRFSYNSICVSVIRVLALSVSMIKALKNKEK